jgi:hypothetical protein
MEDFFLSKKIPQNKQVPYTKRLSPSEKREKFLGEGVAEKKHRNQACLVCFFGARGRLSPFETQNISEFSVFAFKKCFFYRK